MNEWFPTGDGKGYTLSNSLKAIQKHREDFTVVSGLMQDWAHSHGNGGGDHARTVATFLTGCMPKKTAGADIHLGMSEDQIAVQKIGHLTRLPSLELSTDGQRSSGKCDSGYSCAYQFNLAWKNETMPMAPEMDPRLVFERMFGLGASSGNGANAQRMQRMQKSIIDTVLDEAKSLQGKVSAEIYGRDYQQQLAIAEQVKTLIAKTDVVVDVDWMAEADQTEYTFEIDKDKGPRLGVAPAQVNGCTSGCAIEYASRHPS